ncbi:cation channel sperm-associated auxiliary subunit TMEM249 [Pelodiscus sinensis]|uniref:cation channel sperm-associated auxiliary subunit TMEM249 n=1 Tax=Pelodiscus sinensis TaxID=13735 RepID=UPI003F6CFFED
MPRDAFALWSISFFDVEKRLARKLQQNAHFPFQVQRPNVYVMEYYKDTLWKGAVIFLLSVLGVVLYRKYGKTSQDYSGFFAYGMLVGLWLFLSSMYKRHLVINHNRGCYQIYIKRQLWQEGPLHQIYIRLGAQMDAYGKPFYRLILNGYGLEVLALASLSDKYEHMEFLGKQIAHKLRLNYFDWPDVSARHVIRHWPPPPQGEGLEA